MPQLLGSAAAPGPAALSTACTAYGHAVRIDRIAAPRGGGEAVRLDIDEGYRLALTPDEADRLADGLRRQATEARRRNAVRAEG